MMTTASIAATATEFVLKNFSIKDFHARTELWDNGSITVFHTVTLPAGNLQAAINVSADEKVVGITMKLCADTSLTTTSLNNQTEIRPEEFERYMNYHLDALMLLADEYLERESWGPSATWTPTFGPNDDLEPQF